GEPSTDINKTEDRMTEDVVLTPGGFRPKSLVRLVEPGHVLDASSGTLRLLHPSGKVVADFGEIPPRPGNDPLMPKNELVLSERIGALGSGWISYASWRNNTGRPVSLFATSWVVPPTPSTQSGQTIFLFNGIQNA